MSCNDFLFDLYSLQKFDEEQRADIDTAFIKEALSVAIRERLTKKQRQYFLDYYVKEMTMYGIAEKYGVSATTVSRGIKDARRRLWEVLRYTNRRFLYTKMPTGNLVKRGR